MSGNRIRENGNIINLSTLVYTNAVKYDKYKVINKVVNGIWDENDKIIHKLIIGVGEKRVTEEVYEDYEILDSLLNLAHKMYLSETEEGLINKIIKWCNKYGLPMFKAKNSVIRGCDDLQDSFFDFKSFAFQMQDLYHAFDSACNIFGVNIGSIDDRIKFTSRVLCGNEKDSEWRESTWEEKAYFFNARVQPFLSYQLWFDNDRTPILNAYFDDYIEMAKYQLMLLATTPDGYGIQRCQCCQNLFACERANRKYCRYCNSKKNYAQKKRKEKKEAIMKVGE